MTGEEIFPCKYKARSCCKYILGRYVLREYVFTVIHELFSSRRDKVLGKRNSMRIGRQVLFKVNIKILIKTFSALKLPKIN